MTDTFKKLFEILPHSDKWRFAGLFGLMIIGTVLEVVGIGMIPIFISAVSDPGFILDNAILGPVVLALGIENSRDLLLYGGSGIVAIFIVKGIYLVWMKYMKARFIFNRFAVISSKLYKAYLSAPYTYHLGRNTAELIRNVTSETKYISNNVMMPLLTILMESVTVLGIFILLFIMEPMLTSIAFIVVGGAGGLLLKLLKNRIRDHGIVASRERSRMIQGVNEGLGGFKDVSVTNRQPFFLNRFKEYLENLTKAEIFKGVIAYASKPVIEAIAVSGMIGMAFFMIWQGRSIGSVIPMLALFGAAMVRLMPAVSMIVNELNKLRYYVHALTPVYDDIKNLESHSEIKKKETRVTEKLPFLHSVNLQNISFAYPNSETQAISNITLEIPKGSAVGFVGESGAGKSTIADIILGLLEPEQGQILVDGVDVKDKKRLWQNNVGYIPQFIYLSDDTMRNNIAFGISEEDISEEKVQKAVQTAQLTELIDNLPEGLDTVIGERGVLLSGGQRQRIGIARALYDNPELLIMDEATSALDNVTEKEVISAIEDMKGERTIVMIAHRLTTVKNCDVLYLMKNGEIVDTGGHDDLLELSHDFRKMSLIP